MSLSFNDYLDLVNSGIYRQRIKLQVLRYIDFSIQYEITGDIIGGSLNIQRKNGIRRSCSVTIANSTINQAGKYNPNLDKGIFPPRTPFKLWLGLANENDEEYFDECGIFFLCDPTISSNFSESIVTLDMVDAFGLFDNTLSGGLTRTYQIPLGTNIYTAINSILQTENIYPLPCLLDSKYATQTTAYTIIKEAGNGTFGDILTDLALFVSANIYFNRRGFLVLEYDSNDSSKGSVFDFTTDNFQYLGATNKLDYTKFYNSILVIGQNVNGAIFSAESSDTSLLSLTSIPNIGFKRQKRIEDENINSDQLCKDRADYELKRSVAIQNEVTISCIPLYHLDVDQVITITDLNLGFNRERLLINSISIPFEVGGQMSINAVRSIDLPYND